jgi:uncharacterized protein YbbC (DUF1343 family)
MADTTDTTDTPGSTAGRVRTGAAALCADPSAVAGRRLGLLTNFTGVLPDLARNVDAMLAHGVEVAALFGPEHGLRGSGQAGEAETDDVDEATGLPVYDVYDKDPDSYADIVERAGVDALAYDMQDIGVRFWTYVSTMYDGMVSAARLGLPFLVLDRPNPLGGRVTAGPGLQPRFRSFVGRADVPIRHGLTIGELAVLFARHVLPAEGVEVDLEVVPLQGWRRDQPFEATGLPWVPPSPNMPTPDTALAFCGTGLFEGTTVSEGRGTTRPFELLGAPYVDGRLAPLLNSQRLAGVAFREAWYVPTFHKYAGQTVRGVQLHVHDRDAFEPVHCALTMVWAFHELYPDAFGFLPPDPRHGEGYAIDRLWGSDELRLAVESGADVRDLAGPPTQPAQTYPEDVVLYG